MGRLLGNPASYFAESIFRWIDETDAGFFLRLADPDYFAVCLYPFFGVGELKTQFGGGTDGESESTGGRKY